MRTRLRNDHVTPKRGRMQGRGPHVATQLRKKMRAKDCATTTLAPAHMYALPPQTGQTAAELKLANLFHWATEDAAFTVHQGASLGSLGAQLGVTV